MNAWWEIYWLLHPAPPLPLPSPPPPPTSPPPFPGPPKLHNQRYKARPSHSLPQVGRRLSGDVSSSLDPDTEGDNLQDHPFLPTSLLKDGARGLHQGMYHVEASTMKPVSNGHPSGLSNLTKLFRLKWRHNFA